MITTPASFTYDYLSGLKFKELQKLSVQFRVNKRWAKKQELIDNLLALKGKDKRISNDKQEDGNEWRDGGTIFNDLNFDHNDVNRRLTFNVSAKTNGEAKAPQAPAELDHNEEALLCETITSRETYDIPPKKMDLSIELLADPRATFDIPLKSHLIDDGADPRATFDISQNGKILIEENNLDQENSNFKNFPHTQRGKTNIAPMKFKEELGKIKFDINIKDDNLKIRGGKTKPHVKMLTIPYARVTRRTQKDGEPSKNDNSPIKISKKSINIKKLTRSSVNKNDITKSPGFSSVKKAINKQSIVESFTKPQFGESMRSKLPMRLQYTEKPSMDAKTSDEVFEKKTASTSVSKSAKVMHLKKTPLLKDTNRSLKSNIAQTPGDNHTIVAKPITATKMPNFSKIHKKQFDQMDSLHDYIKKKEERIRKLFGTPQPGQQLQSGVPKKDSTDKENLKSVTTPLKRKAHDLKGAKKEAFKCKLPPSKLQSDIKDKNRSHIHGVRTNKRFELQMKLRNM